MLIIGELINTTRKEIETIVSRKKTDDLLNIAQQQVDSGAHYLDINAGTMHDDEPDSLHWMVTTIQDNIDIPLCIDSTNPSAIGKALEVHRGTALVNSVSLNKQQYGAMVPYLKKYNCKVIALCMGEDNIPATAVERISNAVKIVQRLTDDGIQPENIYLDPLIKPVCIEKDNGTIALETILGVKTKLEKVHTVCGLSNISFGLPERMLLNRVFLLMSMAAGLDAVVMNPLENDVAGYIAIAKTLLGYDEYCKNYLKASRSGIFNTTA